MEQTVKRRRTAVKFFVQRSRYIEGRGTVTDWEPFTASVGRDENGAEIMTDCFFCEWLGSFGSRAIQQQADGILCPARVRLPYVKRLHEVLLTEDVRIYKNGIVDELHRFTPVSAPNNYLEANQMLEFQVKKYEVTG